MGVCVWTGEQNLFANPVWIDESCLNSRGYDCTHLGGQWSSAHTFVHHYLSTQVTDMPCFAMGSGPPAWPILCLRPHRFRVPLLYSMKLPVCFLGFGHLLLMHQWSLCVLGISKGFLGCVGDYSYSYHSNPTELVLIIVCLLWMPCCCLRHSCGSLVFSSFSEYVSSLVFS